MYNYSLFNWMTWNDLCSDYVSCYFNYRFVRYEMKTKRQVMVKQIKTIKNAKTDFLEAALICENTWF